MKKLSLILIAAFSLVACEKVDCPNEVGCVEPVEEVGCLAEPIVQKESEAFTERKHIIMEFTGFKCNNCPEGATEIDNIKSDLGKKLIPIAIHSGYYAEPEPNQGFVTDFRTEDGDEYFELFLPVGYPTAVINMKKFNGKYQQTRYDWANILTDEIANSPADIPSLSLQSSYSSKSSTLIAKADLSFDFNTDIKHNLMFMLVEDKIVDVQQDGTKFVDSYTHKHVLRSAFNKPLGQKVNTESIAAGDTFQLETPCFKIDSTWNTQNLILVGVLYDSETKEVQQAEELHIE